jgi:hypothetical protein
MALIADALAADIGTQAMGELLDPLDWALTFLFPCIH